MKYYYTDPLKAVWMANKFGIRLVAYDNEGDMYYCCDDQDDLSGIVSTLECYGDKPMYVHPDDYGVFEPKKGDFVRYSRHDYNGEHTEYGTPRGDDVIEEILKRNNIIFFMPEVEQ